MSKSKKKSSLIIRTAEKEDIPLILEFVKGIAEFEKLSHLVTATEEKLKESLFGKNHCAEVIFAEMNGVAVGFTVFFHSFSTAIGKQGLYIEDIFVKPEFRGKGIGKAMFLHCIKLAKERNCGKIELAVLDWNPARKFYEYFGANPLNGWHIYRIDSDTFENALGK